MIKKEAKYIIGMLIASIILYNSIYFQPLDEKLAEGQQTEFDASSFVEELWQSGLIATYDSATDFNLLMDQLKTDPGEAFRSKGRSLGIGNIAYFTVKGEGTVQRVNEDDIRVQVGSQIIEIELEFIFGNAVRDASGLLKLNDFDRTSDFNAISEAINAKIRKEVIPDFRQKVSIGDYIQFKGALQFNRAHLELSNQEIIPVSVNIIH